MNRNNSNQTIFLRSKPSKFISDEEIDKICEEIPFGHLAQNLKRTEEVCKANMRKMLIPYYENLSQDIELVHGTNPLTHSITSEFMPITGASSGAE